MFVHPRPTATADESDAGLQETRRIGGELLPPDGEVCFPVGPHLGRAGVRFDPDGQVCGGAQTASDFEVGLRTYATIDQPKSNALCDSSVCVEVTCPLSGSRGGSFPGPICCNPGFASR